MLLLKTAFKNIFSGGMRTWLNVAVLSFTFVMIVLYNGIIDGWIQEARRETIQWETGGGQLWVDGYDRYDIFTLQDAHNTIPKAYQQAIDEKQLTPILITQATLYPQGRLVNAQLKGIDPEQEILKIPSHLLQTDGNEITAIIGKRMASASKLKENDAVMIRWRDRNGAFDAREIRIAAVFENKVPAIDAGQIWISLHNLQEMTSMKNEATLLVKAPDANLPENIAGWYFKDLRFLLADLDMMVKANRIESVIIFAFLLSIGLLAVFDTQTLSIFRRQKEIGTYIALGLTPRQVTWLFTLEGTAYSMLAILIGAIWGMPLLYWFAQTGMAMPDMINDAGIAIGEAIYPVYTISSIAVSIIILVISSAFISYLPARKIARQNVVNALKGKIN